jgi:hypothetical protein
MPPDSNDPQLIRIMQGLVEQVEKLGQAVGILGKNQKEVLDATKDAEKRARKDKQEVFQRMRANPDFSHLSDDQIAEFIGMQTARVSAQGAGFSGLYKRLATAQFPSGEEAVSLIGYGQTLRSGRLSRAYGLGALLQQSFAPRSAGLPEGMGFASAYKGRFGASSGKGGFANLSPEEYNAILGITARSDKGVATQHTAMDPQIQAALEGMDLSGLSKSLQKDWQNLFGSGDRPSTSRGVEAARARLLDALVGGEGSSLEALAASQNPMIRGAAAKLQTMQGGGRLASGMFRFGGAIMTGARALAGPIGAAVTAGQAAYSAMDTLYDPARSAAGLGYGFSYNPFSEGARVSMGRSLETRLSALSFGLSGQQTAAARAAVEGIGAGGPGQEQLYNRYYGSMTDVIKETQLDAGVLAPFYEQFMRQGTGSEEISRLTKMLRDDLPKAAAASRMSLQGMAEMIQRTTQAVAANPLAAAGRTEAEISQALTAAAGAGGPPGMANLAGGQNALVVAQTAARLGTGYFSAAQESGQLQATTADLLKRYLGDMSADEFAEFRRTDQGAVQIMAVGQMLGLSNTDIQKIYDIGLEDYAVSAVLTETFSGANLEAGKTRKDLGMKVSAGGRGPSLANQVVSQKIKGTDFDLYKKSGRELQSMYGEEIRTMEGALANMGGSELEDFQKQLQDLAGQDAIRTYKLLEETSQKIAGESTKDGGNGIIDLSDEAKKYFKLEFESGNSADTLPNESTNYGGTNVGMGGLAGRRMAGR